MAGVVELALNGGNWTFTGDGAANGIEVELVAQGEYFVRGTNQGGEPTKIKITGTANLVATEFHVFSALGHLTANLASGNDFLRLVGRGSGNDALRISSLTANLADGDDEVQLKYVSLPGFSLEFGVGNDELSMVEVTAMYWYDLHPIRSIKTGAGKDRVEIEDSRFRTILIDTGADADAVLLEELNSNLVEVSTGAGEDEVAVIGGEFFGKVSIDTGADHDEAALFAVSADEIYANMGDGDDFLYLVANEARAAKLLGGNGKDVLDFDPFIGINNEFETLGTDGFETMQ
jgi:hypothetical protein